VKNSIDTAFEKGIEKGFEKGIEKGIEKGMEKRNIEIAKTGLKEGLPIEVIMKLTGLTEKEIKEIKEKSGYGQ